MENTTKLGTLFGFDLYLGTTDPVQVAMVKRLAFKAFGYQLASDGSVAPIGPLVAAPDPEAEVAAAKAAEEAAASTSGTGNGAGSTAGPVD